MSKTEPEMVSVRVGKNNERFDFPISFNERAKRNHGGQSLSRLEDRGGLCWAEAYWIINDIGWSSKTISEADAEREVRQHFATPTPAPIDNSVAERIEEVAPGFRDALRGSAPIESTLGGLPAETAPAACHVLAGRFDNDCGEWVFGVVATPLTYPFTHWWPLPDLRTPPQSGEVSPGRVEAGKLADKIDWLLREQELAHWQIELQGTDALAAVFGRLNQAHRMAFDLLPAISAALRQQPIGVVEDGVERLRETLPLIEQICAEEGATVTLTGSNPDFNGHPNEAVTICNGATEWKDRTFRADTVADCLRAALSSPTDTKGDA